MGCYICNEELVYHNNPKMMKYGIRQHILLEKELP